MKKRLHIRKIYFDLCLYSTDIYIISHNRLVGVFSLQRKR